MKVLYSIILASMLYIPTQAQSWITRNGKISFYSKTPMEDIKAVNSQVFAAIDVSKKTIAFTLLQKNFLFEKQLMQEHFNENYIESDKYPKAQFEGTITGNIGTTPGVYKVQVDGKLTMHGVTQPVSMPAELNLQQGKLVGKSAFSIKPSDYNIKIPSLVKDKIAAEIPVQVSAEFLPK
ncbi:YceI family protein [Chitinophaga oryziterrae]|uniref:YceI family protein n=1 Tax=Chitinophaga oryziterrae TaxID=1031224 RepID=A0A6N8J6E7_9BACT|nr:YceI family protein [Chitinophaga oryziterrae]MVT39826.1 YceI family protein [Chitinophaga oryziterrae]